jgi:hypothetical protein
MHAGNFSLLLAISVTQNDHQKWILDCQVTIETPIKLRNKLLCQFNACIFKPEKVTLRKRLEQLPFVGASSQVFLKLVRMESYRHIVLNMLG